MPPDYKWMYSQEVLQDNNRIGRPGNMVVPPSYQVNYPAPMQTVPPTESVNYQQPLLSNMKEVQEQYMQKEMENKQKKEEQTIETVTEKKEENESKVDSTVSNMKEEEKQEVEKKDEEKQEKQEETKKSEERKRPFSHFIRQSTEEEKEDDNRYIDPETGEKWIRCQNPFCGKWRFVPDEVEMPSQNPWFCILNTWDEGTASCTCPQLQEGYIIVKKKEEPEKEWMPKKQCHFEKITPITY